MSSAPIMRSTKTVIGDSGAPPPRGLESPAELARSTSAPLGQRYTYGLWALVVLTLFIAIGHMRHWLHGIPNDLGAFYSAGKVVLSHGDPYRLQPLLDIEKTLRPAEEFYQGVTPVPLPSYMLALLSALALLPVHVAAWCMALLLACATIALGYSLSRMSNIPLPLALCTAFFGAFYAGSELGQIAPLAISALALAAVFVREKRWTAGAIATAAIMIQPQFGIPVAISALLFVPEMRAVLLSCYTILAILGLSLGVQCNLEYLQVLHLQALSEAGWSAQFSLTWLAHALGLSIVGSLTLGSISTILSLIFSLFIIGRTRDISRMNGAIILLPAATAVLGGTYVHGYQLAAALPAAICLIQVKKSWFNPALGAALLVMPFSIALSSHSHYLPTPAIASAATAILTSWALLVTFNSTERTFQERVVQSTLYTILLSGLFVALVVLHPLPSINWQSYHRLLLPGTTFASIDWANSTHFLITQQPGDTLFWIVAKIPLWGGAAYHCHLLDQITLVHAEPGIREGSPERSTLNSRSSS